MADGRVLPCRLGGNADTPALVRHGFGEEVILGEILAERRHAALVVNEIFPHQRRHAGGTVDAQEVCGQIDARVDGSEINLPKTDEKKLTATKSNSED